MSLELQQFFICILADQKNFSRLCIMIWNLQKLKMTPLTEITEIKLMFLNSTLINTFFFFTQKKHAT